MELYQEIAEKIKKADGILIGASNGLSIAEGYNIFANDERFQRHFSDFQQKYRFQSMIQGSFGRFASENERWSYCSRMAYYYAYSEQPTPLMQTLYTLVKDKPYFVATSNTDDHFGQAGFARDNIFELEGSMAEMQCAKGCHDAIYDSRDAVLAMREHEQGMRIPDEYLPKCPVCGGAMQLHIPMNKKFIPGQRMKQQRKHYQDFIERFQGKKLLILEFGIGARNQMIKAPLMQLAYQEPNAFYITFNKGELYIPPVLKEKSLGVDGDIKAQIAMIQAEMP
ncbi:NAD-dependent protein deacetylase, SIR2 family [Gemmiger sp.]